MNNDLLKRIDEMLGQFGISTDEFDLLSDCRAEIERLESELEVERIRLAACGVVADSNTQKSAKENRLIMDAYKSASLESVIRASDREMELREQVERLSKPYVPMTDDEMNETIACWFDDKATPLTVSRYIESAVVDRYNEQRGVR